MAILHKITANGSQFKARSGAVLLEAALMHGIEFPHDCRAGRCGTCLTRVRRGTTVGGESGRPRMVYACQARVLSNLSVEYDELPAPRYVAGRVESVTELVPDVVELEVRPAEPLDLLPGQYCHFTFQGFPARTYSPTVPLKGSNQLGTFRLQIQRVEGGKVSPQLGTGIKAGHPLKIEGPFGSAFHRPGRRERLVLASRGTGFAPILAVADAALREDRHREIVLVAGARNLAALYMPSALGRLSSGPGVSVIATAEEPQNQSSLVRQGPVAEHVPALNTNDIVYVAGGRRLVESVASLARDVGAEIYFDEFEASGSNTTGGGIGGILSMASDWFG